MSFKDSQFDYLFSAIADKYPAIAQKTDTTQFQFAGSPMAAAWTKGDSYEAHQFANHVPADVNGFYTPNPGELSNAYGSLIASIDPGVDGSKDPTYIKLIKQKQDAESAQKSNLDQMKAAWATYVQANTDPKTGQPAMSFDDWKNSEIGGLEYQNAIDSKQAELDDITKNIATLVKSFNAALAQDQEKFTDDKYQAQYTRKGTPVQLPEITIEGDLGQDVSNWDNAPEGSYDLDVTLTKDSEVKTPWKTLTRTDVSQHCFKTSVTSKTTSSRIINDSHYKLRVMLKGFKSYNITFGGWYDSTYVSPNTAKFSPASTVNSETFFAANGGALHMIPSQVWVMYQPEIELTISSELYKETVKGDLESNIDWLDILSMRFSADAGHSIVKEGETVTTISFKSPTLQGPQVYGVTSLLEVK
ncbi:hypothetical protein SAMN05661096_00092 [Marivirga sericea]|uniref:Uncharacterized protein n=1 Tax=Marivirga sericea TaxID=1028 RepID=A0A1X7I0L2_9BACT|nr:hypothetical protein [Marivirga sericea]SMG07923.1 hypothetical protein SAMN05661096_00092 [Marivirga sericea]